MKKSQLLVMGALGLCAGAYLVSFKKSAHPQPEALSQMEEETSALTSVRVIRPKLSPQKNRGPAAATSQDATVLTEDFGKNPERVTLLLLSLHEEYQEDLQRFYQNDLELEPGQLARLLEAADKNVDEEDLPLEAGVEVVSSKIFMGRNHWDYLQEVREILSDAQYKKFKEFHRSWKSALKQRDSYLSSVIEFPETQ